MFGMKKDFALLARQVSVSSRNPSSKSTPILVDVYQVRLWKLMHTPDKADVDAIAQAFQVGLAKNNRPSNNNNNCSFLF